MAPHFILTDIEGTTTELAFVHRVLFPYAAERLPDFIRQCGDNTEVRACLNDVKATLCAEATSSQGNDALSDEDAIEALLRWIREDCKQSALKQLQGMLWKVGYETGAYRAHVYPDVPSALALWRERGIGLGVYSSGSVQAQRLLFRYSTVGDLTPYFSHYFDTRIGNKRDADSYARIAQALKIAPLDILFLSDIAEELDAAAHAGFQVIQVVRGPETVASSYPTVPDFSAIQLEAAGMIC